MAFYDETSETLWAFGDDGDDYGDVSYGDRASRR